MSYCGPQEKTEGTQGGGCCSPDGKKSKCCQMMSCNVGGVDRAFRTGVGAVLVTLAATSQVGPWGWIGVVLVASGLVGWCGGYTLLGINTGKKCCSGGSCSTEGDKGGCCK